ncbi:MAG: choline oxidase [Gammaproteobacteria bacterium]
MLAKRLAERSAASVILIEAGKTDEGDPAATDLSRLDEQDDSYDWGYQAQTCADSNSAMAYARAKMLGGCANHNDCAFLQPPSSDFDHWPAGWDAAGNASAFSRINQQLHIESSPAGNALSRAFIDANVELGLSERNFREGIASGSGWFPLNAKAALRQSSSIAYLHPLSDLPANLQVITEVQATRILLKQQQAVGVDTNRGKFFARREVILCAGSINTPQLLMLSGIGNADDLQDLGIDPVQHLPGVGQNLIDHVAANIAYRLKEPTPAWQLTPCEATALIQIDATAAAPDLLYHFVLRLREKYVDDSLFAGVSNGVKISPNVARPKSRGQLKLVSADPNIAPAINLNYLSDTEGYDRRLLIAGLRYARRLAASDSLAPWMDAEIFPGPDIDSDDELTDYIRSNCETVYHPCGTCKMGSASDPMTVVTPDLKVKGIAGLRVADASVFADMVTVNICNTVMMVAERAADLIFPAENPGPS